MDFEPLEHQLLLYERRGWAERIDGRWRLTPSGFLISNQLIGDLLSCQRRATLSGTLQRLRQEGQRPQTEQT